MILSVIERASSPFVSIQFAGADGKVRREKTHIRKDDPEKALKIAKALNAKERELLGAGLRGGAGGAWQWDWVGRWLSSRYAAKVSTRDKYLTLWGTLALYLRVHGLRDPAAVTRADCYEYLTWRRTPKKRTQAWHAVDRAVKINTAIGELKLFGMILEEAKARGLAGENPARKLGLAREDVEPKPEISDAEIGQIFAALKTREEWMRRSFFLALQTGLRFGDTALRRAQVNRERGEITLDRTKGGAKRTFTIRIYPEIAAALDAWLATPAAKYWSLPPKERDLASLQWTKFFREIKLGHLCFHCTRVTFITRGARAGVPEAAMMKMVNHASKEIHRIYQRLADADALAHRARFAIPSGGVSIP